jgi:hypothetical protein
LGRPCSLGVVVRSSPSFLSARSRILHNDSVRPSRAWPAAHTPATLRPDLIAGLVRRVYWPTPGHVGPRQQ